MKTKEIFENSAQRELYNLELARYNYKAGFFVSLMLIFMEAAMIIYALVTFDFSLSISITYTVFYCILLAVGILTYLFCLYCKNRLSKIYRIFNIGVIIFACIILAWGAALSSLDISIGYYPIIFFSFATGFAAVFHLPSLVSLIIVTVETVLFYILNLTLGNQSFDANVFINYLTYFCIIAAVIIIKDRQTMLKFKTECSLKSKDVQLKEMLIKLDSLNKQLIDKAVTDPLTGAYNRLAFNNNIETLLKNCIKNTTTLTAVMYDIDSFKYVNDVYGHLVGDAILKSVCDKIIKHTHRNCVYRFGGEEFVLLLENMTPQAAMKLANKIREDVAGEVYTEKKVAVTISGGVYTAQPDAACRSDDFWVKADSALYKAKHSGKNCVVLFQDGDFPYCRA